MGDVASLLDVSSPLTRDGSMMHRDVLQFTALDLDGGCAKALVDGMRSSKHNASRVAAAGHWACFILYWYGQIIVCH